MIQEDKELLLKDLCSRLPYGVKCKWVTKDTDLLGIMGDIAEVGYDMNDYDVAAVEDIKPYLRPMKSMTKVEKEEYRKLCKKVVRKTYVPDGKVWPTHKMSYRYGGTKTEYYDTYQSIDYLISRHFDYMGLIGKKLALKATKGMY